VFPRKNGGIIGYEKREKGGDWEGEKTVEGGEKIMQRSWEAVLLHY